MHVWLKFTISLLIKYISSIFMISNFTFIIYDDEVLNECKIKYEKQGEIL
jgi:hypothetical protein